MIDEAEMTEPIAVESDPRFPSGPWTGFFLQPMLAGKHWMELNLRFQGGSVRGEGRDWVGEFLVHGSYDVGEGKVWWSKRYVGRHDVAYMGYNEGRGIWGTWELTDPAWRGGFHIWPEGMNLGENLTDRAHADAPKDNQVIISWDDHEVESLEPVGIGVGGSEAPEVEAEPWN